MVLSSAANPEGGQNSGRWGFRNNSFDFTIEIGVKIINLYIIY